MNDSSPSGPYGSHDNSHGTSYAGYPGYTSYDDTTAYAAAPEQPYGTDNGHFNSPSYEDDPLFGAMPGQEQPTATAMYGTGGYDTATAMYDTGTHAAYSPYETASPYDTGSYDTGSYDTGAYGTTAYDMGAYDTGTYSTAAFSTAVYDTGAYDTGAYSTTGYDTGAYGQGGDDPLAAGGHDADRADSPWDSGSYSTLGIPTQTDPYWAADSTTSTGHWDELSGYAPAPGGAESWSTSGDGSDFSSNHAYDSGSFDAAALYDSGAGHPDTGSWSTVGLDPATPTEPTVQAAAPTTMGTGAWDSGSRQVSTLAAGVDAVDEQVPGRTGPLTDSPADAAGSNMAAGDSDTLGDIPVVQDAGDPYADPYDSADPYGDAEPSDDAGAHGEHPVPDISPLAAAGHPGGRGGRRRAAKPRRSALLTVAVPSVAVMGVAGIAAASVGNMGEDSDKGEQAAPDPTSVKPSTANSKLDTQLDGVRADAGDFAGRASRTQERIDLKERQEAERKRKEAEAARKEAERPKFALPVDQPGLSAYYGQSGVNWLSLHTGIDFPVGYGTPVKAATDGIVTTKYDLAYGNMMIVTAADGTETWYCHLSSSKIRGGEVKAGDTIGYAGSSGKSTGPHLHFEVRPGGGSAIDPLAWFRGKGLDPT